ncbi:TatD family hydrolase [Methylotenera sp.]|uniref:TatD family hydrolase n=1 Tax=Methylotenera sp. TaxID=2051956 RepID=UPI002718D895|nr:TatD family hydrolase [Methylotenera sp.]MDO9204691.1 TatD family hydrolase [Methylotenera sp.]MDO9394605.1 TatD family hydrolase [Methylotenera sp.]MDP1522851.1 TatD family hydrolase [Methylotenera sp.]MDP2071548.1 TatD family hydrolase [Methylotenera sp.]MDP2231742.1 TatD family hydrolase [Methylotenera sp.]
MLVDSHCHLNFPELLEKLSDIKQSMLDNEVGYALCISVTLPDFPQVLALAEANDNFFASVGVHPDYEDIDEPTVDELLKLANHPKVIAIGETGLDYFRLTGDLEWQRLRFRNHIRAAIACGKPLVIHTRNAAEDTLRIMREENAQKIGGVMHCFTESLDVALQAIELGFYISFSGIVTFKNALSIKEVAQKIPLDRLLVETDSPYLAPVPYRGKINQPSYVKNVAEEIARLRDISFEEISIASTDNFFRLFSHATAYKT